LLSHEVENFGEKADVTGLGAAVEEIVALVICSEKVALSRFSFQDQVEFFFESEVTGVHEGVFAANVCDRGIGTVLQ